MKTKSARSSFARHTAANHNRSALALVVILFGTMFLVSGLLQYIPVFSAIATSVSSAAPLLGARQTLFLGLGILATGAYALTHFTEPRP